MNPWQQLLDVQALDTTLAQLDHRQSQLPERLARDEIESQLAALATEMATVEAERSVLLGDQKRLEDEIALLTDKVAEVDKQLYSGGSDVKHLQALQEEIGSIKRRISSLEDRELELMVQAEPLDERIAVLAGRKDDLDAEAARLTAALAEVEAVIDAERAEVLTARTVAIAAVTPEALAEYDTVRARLGGVAVATLKSGVCGACHMKLSAVEYDRILHLPPDEPVRCEDCGRFLVRS